MKRNHLIICFAVVLCLLGNMEAGLLLNTNRGIFCKWTSKRGCDHKTPYCVTATISGTVMCKNYRSECKYLLDQCLGKTEYGRTGTQAASTACTNIPIGSVGTCQ